MWCRGSSRRDCRLVLGQQVVVENRPGSRDRHGCRRTSGSCRARRPYADGNSSNVCRKRRALPPAPLSSRRGLFSEVSMITEFPLHPGDLFRSSGQNDRGPHPGRTDPQRTADLWDTSGVGSLPASGHGTVCQQGEHQPPAHSVPGREAPAITELLGRRIDFVLDQPTALMDFIRDGRFRARWP